MKKPINSIKRTLKKETGYLREQLTSLLIQVMNVSDPESLMELKNKVSIIKSGIDGIKVLQELDRKNHGLDKIKPELKNDSIVHKLYDEEGQLELFTNKE